MIIDFHAHVYTDQDAPKTIAAAERRVGIEAGGQGTVSDLRKSMRSSGIDLSVLLPVARQPQQVGEVNDWFLRAAGEGLITFGAIHPFQPDLVEELDRLKNKEVRGVKVVPFLQKVYPDDPRCDPLYKALIERDMVLVFHAGKEPVDLREVFGTPDRFARVADRHPDLTLVLSHLGGFRMWRDVRKFLIPPAENVYFDTSYVSTRLSLEETLALILEMGTDRVLFGTDYPWAGQAEELELIKSLDLSGADRAMILEGNARRLLRI